MNIPPICPYCGGFSQKTTGQKIYPHRPDLAEKTFYFCQPCDAYVGCHQDGTPLGRLANKKLRIAKQAAHAAFDPLWKTGKTTRKEAYKRLAQKLEIPPENCHIGHFDEETCAKVTLLCHENPSLQ